VKVWIDISLYRIHPEGKFGIARIEKALVTLLPKHHQNVGFFWIDDKFQLNFSDKLENKPQLMNNFKAKNRFSFDNLEILKREPRGSRASIAISRLISLTPNWSSTTLWALAKFAKNILSKFSWIRKFAQKNNYKNRRLFLDKEDSSNVVKNQRLEEIRKEDLFLIASNDWERRIYQQLSKKLEFQPRLAFIIYDLIPYENPNFAVDLATASRFTFWIGSVAQKAEMLFHISKYTQNSFERMLCDREIKSFAQSHVISIPPGLSNDGLRKEPSFARVIDKEFVLVVCTLEVRKNHKVLLTAASEAQRLGEKFPQLVFIGSIGWGYEEIRRDIELNEALHGRALHFSGVDDDELRWLYDHCLLVAYPSITEGLGLPILEARQFGKKVICSLAPVFKEVSDANTIFLSPYDSFAWKNEIQRYSNAPYDDAPLEMPDFGSWDETIKSLVRIMER
jgi:glycosyltransferase involved in cell wall biosynthesis